MVGRLLLLDTPYLTLHRTADGSLLMRRTALPFPTIPLAIGEFAAVQRCLLTDPGYTGGLVINSTAIQGRNDDAFEAALKPIFQRFMATSRRTAVVVRSIPGQLQTRRLGAGTSASNFQLFNDEQEALAHVAPRPGDPPWASRPG